MKLKFKLLILLLSVTTVSLQAGEFTKNLHEGFVKSAIRSLQVTNKYGQIKINDLGGDSITVDVIITVETSTEKKATYLFDQIDINIQKRGTELVLATNIKESFKTKQHFTIDYMINIPSDRNLVVSNKYGNVSVNSLNAKGSFEVHYGSIYTGNMVAPEESPIKLDLAYSKADLESFNSMICHTKYSKLYVGEAGKLKAESKYSTINVKELSKFGLESKYDGIKIRGLNELNAKSKYTNYTIEELRKSLVLNTEYGSVRIDKVSENLERIDLTNRYGGINIGIDNLVAYRLNAECDYCNVKVPEGSFRGNREKERSHLRMNGTVGASSPTAIVKIKSRYGEVKLTK